MTSHSRSQAQFPTKNHFCYAAVTSYIASWSESGRRNLATPVEQTVSRVPLLPQLGRRSRRVEMRWQRPVHNVLVKQHRQSSIALVISGAKVDAVDHQHDADEERTTENRPKNVITYHLFFPGCIAHRYR